MVRMAQDPSIVDIFDEGSGGRSAIEVEERRVDDGSALEGRTVADAPAPVLAVRRPDGEVIAGPSADTPLGAGDVVLLLRHGLDS
jgi:K+/H+ antiporter YhaU regulatory subunit KhtT